MSQWNIIIEDLAQTDLRETYIWYKKEKIGLGEEFIDAFEETIAKIERNPHHASLYDETYRSATFKRYKKQKSIGAKAGLKKNQLAAEL